MRREVSAAKTAAYKKFLDDIDALPAASAIQKHLKWPKHSCEEKSKTGLVDQLIAPEVFSAHIASICSSEEAVERRHEGDFVPQWSFRNDN